MSDDPTEALDLPDDPHVKRLFSSSHRIWVLPTLRAVADLGGTARPLDVEARIRETSAAKLSPLQWARVMQGAYVRWARFGMKKAGLVGGERGVWTLTDRGRAYLQQHRDDSGEIPDDLPELDAEQAGDLEAAFETLPATSYEGYFIPLLDILASRGPTAKRELTSELGRRMGAKFLVGDLARLPRGHVVWRYRTSWALTYLKKAGSIRNPTVGFWEITESGRARLESEKANWTIQAFQKSSVRARPSKGAAATDVADEIEEQSQSWSIESWSAARNTIGPAVFTALSRRLRPEDGPTPADSTRPLARNVILYGPPGTGKTFLARAAARALTAQPDPDEDARWHVVQFHPSYAYEDFIQGLRPDLAQRELRYTLSKGPFLQLCEAAAEEPDEFFVLVIDEINRGDPARIFGELLYALEYRGEPVDLPNGGQLTVPPNVVVVGTMNSADRSVALVDYALRRRFGFIRVDPDPEVIRTVRGGDAFASAAAEALEEFNEWLCERLGRDHTLGHSFFLSRAVELNDPSGLELVWDLDIHPLLEEYFYGEQDALAEAAKRWKTIVSEALRATNDDADDSAERPVDT